MVMYARKHPRSADGYYEGPGRHRHKDSERHDRSSAFFHKNPSNGKVPYSHHPGKPANSRYSSRHDQIPRRNVDKAERSPERNSHHNRKQPTLSGDGQNCTSANASKESIKLYSCGDWAEYLSSVTGRKYYYNCKTEVSQWEKPKDWSDRASIRRSTDPKKPPSKSLPSSSSSNSISNHGSSSHTGRHSSHHPYHSTSSNHRNLHQGNNSVAPSGRQPHSSARKNITSPYPTSSGNHVDNRTLPSSRSSISPRSRNPKSDDSQGSDNGLVTSLSTPAGRGEVSSRRNVDLQKLLNQISSTTNTQDALKTVQALQYTLLKSGVSIPKSSPGPAPSPAHRYGSVDQSPETPGHSAAADIPASAAQQHLLLMKQQQELEQLQQQQQQQQQQPQQAQEQLEQEHLQPQPASQSNGATASLPTSALAAVASFPASMNRPHSHSDARGGAGNEQPPPGLVSPVSDSSQRSSSSTRLSATHVPDMFTGPTMSTLAALKSASHTLPTLCQHFYDAELVDHVQDWGTEVLERERSVMFRETSVAANAFLAHAASLKMCRSALRRDDILLSQHVQREHALRKLEESVLEHYVKKLGKDASIGPI